MCLLTSHWSPVIGGCNYLWLVVGLSSCGASLTRLAHPARACCTHPGSRQGVPPGPALLLLTHTRGRHLPFFVSFVLSCCRHMPAELLEGGLLSKASDVYSWGVLCWEVCGGGCVLA